MTKTSNIRWASWVAIGLTIILTFTGMAFAYGQATNEIEDNTAAIVSISEDVDKHDDDIFDMKILMNELLYYQSDIAETLKEIKINTDND